MGSESAPPPLAYTTPLRLLRIRAKSGGLLPICFGLTCEVLSSLIMIGVCLTLLGIYINTAIWAKDNCHTSCEGYVGFDAGFWIVYGLMLLHLSCFKLPRTEVVPRCDEGLHQMVRKEEKGREGGGGGQRSDDFMAKTLDRCRRLTPNPPPLPRLSSGLPPPA